jgi:uncharacterized protein
MAEPPIDPTLPEVVQRYLRLGHTLDDIRLDAHGRWWHNNTPISHPRLVSLFSRSIDRTPGGTWVLKIGSTTYPIRVDKAPLFVHRVDTSGDTLCLFLSDGSLQHVPLSSLYAPSDGGLHALLPDGHTHARWTLDAYIRFVDAHVIEDDAGQFIAVMGSQRHILRDSPPLPAPSPHPNC